MSSDPYTGSEFVTAKTDVTDRIKWMRIPAFPKEQQEHWRLTNIAHPSGKIEHLVPWTAAPGSAVASLTTSPPVYVSLSADPLTRIELTVECSARCVGARRCDAECRHDSGQVSVLSMVLL